MNTAPIVEIVTVEVAKLPVIVGANPEMADIVNPDGFIWRDCHFIIACTARGRRFQHQVAFEAPPAESLLAKIRSRGVIDLSFWNEAPYIYGSQEWQDEEAFRITHGQEGW